METDNSQRARDLAIVVALMVILTVGTLSATVASGGATPSLAGSEGTATDDPIASATRTIEDTEVQPNDSTTVRLEIEIVEDTSILRVDENFWPSFTSVEDVAVTFEGGSGTVVRSSHQNDSVFVRMNDVEAGTTVFVEYVVTVRSIDAFGNRSDPEPWTRHTFSGVVETRAQWIQPSGDAVIEVSRDDEDDDTTPEDTPTDPLPEAEAIATIDESGCEGTTKTTERPDPEVLAFQFTDQRTPGYYVHIDELRITRGGRVVLTDADGTELGRTNYLPPGKHENVPVGLDEPLETGEHELTATVRDVTPENDERTATITVGAANHDGRPLNVSASAPARVAVAEDLIINVSSSDPESGQSETKRTGVFEVVFDDVEVSGWETVTIPGIDIEQGSYRNGSSVNVSPEGDLDAEPCDLYYVWIVDPESGTAVPTGPIMVVEPALDGTDTTTAGTDGDDDSIEGDDTGVSTPGFGIGTAILALVLIGICGRWVVGDREFSSRERR